jgi:hypothetical protein
MALIPLVIVLACSSNVFAQANEQVLYSFQGLPDGAQPVGEVVFDSAGNLYGATTEGGSSSCISVAQCGTVYELSPPSSKGGSWTETVLYIFKGNTFNDGASPVGGLVMDSAGNLYGSTAYGGTGNCVLLGTLMGCGTVYELSPPTQSGGAWSEKVIYSFPDAAHGYKPNGDLTFDSLGNLYGATEFGGGYGTSCDPYFQYCGAIFELIPPQQQGGAWTEQVLYGFKGMTQATVLGDGGGPNGGLALDSTGNIYGTTVYGGSIVDGCSGPGGRGCGTVFELHAPLEKGGNWSEEILVRFTGNNGALPMSGLVFGRDGNLYGSVTGGGSGNGGEIYQLHRPRTKGLPWTETGIYEFSSLSGGSYPESEVLFDSEGRIYGTDYSGRGEDQQGSVYMLSPPKKEGGSWNQTTLHGFTHVPDGENPTTNLIFDNAGNLFSTTVYGGSACGSLGCGTVFEVSP